MCCDIRIAIALEKRLAFLPRSMRETTATNVNYGWLLT